ncbi:hypothetical protein OKA05_25315 [Luteolibacter arcticus]|uniref:Uncharacterized protein n=1 Tax=Luteolibacter arcticus TaxID=1581411 RepID=A0ABT3GQV3_9BACT|nr:hypothetical protein [Luteolibacter arcticus]MCW1925904.1 hypothetical protein [Luteolibacter arcticus]
MKSTLPMGRMTRALPLRLLISLAAATPAVSFSQITTEFLGPEEIEEFGGYVWSDSSNWSSGTPAPEDDAVIPNRLDEFENPYWWWTPFLDVHATVNSLFIADNAALSNNTIGPGKNLFVEGTTTIEGGLVNGGGQYSLGNLTNFSLATRTITGGRGFSVFDRQSITEAILQFEGADIVVNRSGFNLFGPNAVVRDQNTGLDAFRNLAENHGFITLDDGHQIQTTGNFLNGENGLLTLAINPSTRTTVFNIAGNFTNNGRVRLGGNSTFLVAGGLHGSGEIEVTGLPCNLNVLGTYNLAGGNLNLGGSGIDSFILKATTLEVTGDGTVSGNGTIDSVLTVTDGTIAPGNSAGQIVVTDDLTLASGSTLEIEIGGTSHDKIVQSAGTSGVTLGGELSLSTIDDFDDEVLYTSTYEILTSDMPIAGSFANVLPGARLATPHGSFKVSYGPGSAAPAKVVLSDYQAVITPKSFAQWVEEQELTAPDDDAEADPNGDGIENLEAYFRGVPATGSTKPKPIAAVVADGLLTVSISAPKSVTGITVRSSTTSTGFVVWDSGPTPVVIDATPTRNVYQVTMPASNEVGFVRFVIEKEEILAH